MVHRLKTSHMLPLFSIVILTALGVAGNYFKLTLFFNVDFIFGSIFTILAIHYYGPFAGMTTAFVSSAYTYLLWNHPYALIIFCCESLFISLLYGRKSQNIVLLDTLFWLFLGMPLVMLFYHFIMDMSYLAASIMMLKQSMNGIMNALVAGVVIQARLIPLKAYKTAQEGTPFQLTLFHIIASFVLINAVIAMTLSSRAQLAKIEEEIKQQLRNTSALSGEMLNFWLDARLKAASALSILVKKPDEAVAPQIQEEIDLMREAMPEFLRIGIMDAKGIAVAFSPSHDEAGAPVVGRDFSNRPYYLEIKDRMKPVFSDVLTATIGHPIPIVILACPIVRDRELQGFSVGAIDLSNIRAMLSKFIADRTIHVTLLDKQGRIVASTKDNLRPLDLYTPGDNREIIRDSSDIYLISQKNMSNISVMERWKTSAYAKDNVLSGQTGWKLIVEAPLISYRDYLYRYCLKVMVVVMLLISGTVLFSSQLSAKMVAPLNSLQRVTTNLPEKLSEYQSIEYPSTSILEIKSLIDNFKSMSQILRQKFGELQHLNTTLQEEEARYRLLAENASDMISRHLPDSTFLYASPSCRTLVGYSPEELVGRSLYDFLHPEDMERLPQQGSDSWTASLGAIVYRFKRKDGDYSWLETKSRELQSSPGNDTLEIVAISRDINDRKRAQAILEQSHEELERLVEERTSDMASTNEKLNESEALIRAIVDNAADGIITIDDKGIIQSFNREAGQIFGYDPEQVQGQNVKMLMAAPYSEEHDSHIRNFLETRQAKVIGFGRELFGGRRKDGSIFPIYLAVSEVPLGKRRMFTGIIRDITQQKAAERDLQEAKEQAETASRVKSEFLTTMSHEIRTPLNSIIGMGDLLWESQLDAEQRRYVEVFRNAGKVLLSLINNVLDLSKIEAGRLDLEMTKFDPRALIARIVEVMEPVARGKGLAVLTDISPEVPDQLVGDLGRVQQILINLLGNGIKFTHTGSVRVEAAKMAAGSSSWSTFALKDAIPSSESVLIRFSVRDTGIGIEENKLQEIFKSFTQGDSTITRRYGGTGLGLTISIYLAQMMGGTIEVESTHGEGSTFHFTAPFTVASRPEAAEVSRGGKSKPPEAPLMSVETSPQAPGAPLRILLVEDTEENQFIVRSFLKKTLHTLDLAENGLVGLERFKAGNYDVVLMDMEMPVMDGITATRAIRQWETEQFRQPTPIIALTAHAFMESQEKSRSAGCNAHLTKPIEKETLLATLWEYGLRAKA